MGESGIFAEGLVKSFGDVRALGGVDLAVPEGSVLGLLGPNGAGKTTGVRILTTLLKPDAGRASVGGFDVQRDASEVRSIIGLTGQYAAVDELLSGRENLFMIGRLLGFEKERARNRADELLATFDLTDASKKIVKQYSGGMRRRLDLAASLVGNPRFLFLDEPTTGLDPRSRRQVWSMIGGLVGQGTTVLLTTQYLEEADLLADEIVVMDHGRVVAAGTSEALKAKVGGLVVEVVPSDKTKVGDVAKLVGRLCAAEPSIDEDAAMVTVPVGDDEAFAKAVAALQKAGIPVSHLALRRPSLDEVFLSLTGHPAEDESTLETEGSSR
jgi:daunorubicin resistance ABC transporter ATP-binding subunit